ncbi:D-alanyl-D-alanine carboxypeptidase [uncultured Rhodospira sp.]|uniref:D-alanyl-D-alanine carboxypeptidase n=1 Tax=uncultured Rhodospira sp. TaxID=1936189 RepID=UPI002625D950|nr:D-alanyl-D-alanine carboxypeptidase [uncultured Rhodospira sp.]
MSSPLPNPSPCRDPARPRRAAWRLILARLSAMLALVLVLGTIMPSDAAARYAAIVVDATSGRILHGRHIDTQRYPASLTKMMTLYMLFEAIDTGRVSMETRLRVSTRAAGQPASKLGLRAGSTITVRDAIRALVTKSANDVATVVAEALGDTEIGFARLMTEKAHQLGMRSTSFRNASGLPNSGQKSTARDMATLSLSLLRHFPHHYHFFSTTSFRYQGHIYTGHNHLMKRYAGADGLKTGYISASGFNLAFSATRHGRRLVGVVYGGRTARSRDDHMAELMDKGFQVVAQAGYSPFTGQDRIRVVARPDLPSGAPPPRPPMLPPGKAPVPQVASVADVLPRVIERLLSAPKPSVDATEAAVPSGSAPPQPASDGTWGVQVGAFSALGPAERAAHDAAKLLGPRFEAIRVRVIPHAVADGHLYRARVVGMPNEAKARAACRDLRAQQRSCLVVVPTGWTVAAR